MPFGEYELSPSLIGLSLLHTVHPEAFQRLSPATKVALFGLAFAAGTCLMALSLAARRQLVGSLCKRHAVTTISGSDRL